jgi:NAD(P)-dependent dehydrogenase (short-subunit alcohol dehydrogenase family)
MQDKFVLITGGTGGLGVAVTQAVLRSGTRSVTIPYRSEDALSELRMRLSNEFISRLNFVSCNLQIESEVQSLTAQMPQIDVLIHLVGGFDMGKTDEYSFADWQKMLDLNLNTTFFLAKYCLRRMKETGYGRMVAVSSRAALQPAGRLAAYGAAKAGVCNLMSTIAEETKQKDLNITANTVLPSVIDTPKNRQAMGSDSAWSWVTPESLAKVICFLASESAKDIRGASIPVYGKA